MLQQAVPLLIVCCNDRILGAGLVGATAAIALSRLQDVKVTVFERSPGPRIAGAWISLQVSGM
jgi:salicylate hydroxylase